MGEFLFKQKLLKLISLIMAVFIWFYVLNSRPVVVEKKIMVEFKIPVGMAISNKVVNELLVKAKGARSFMNNFFTGDERVVLDLKGYPYKRNEEFPVLINPADIPIPFGVEVISVTPGTIMVSMERQITKKVLVKPVLIGEVAVELKLIKYYIKPSSVLITGPVNVLRKISKVSTVPIDISFLEGTGELPFNVGDLDQRIVLEKDDDIKFHYVIRSKKANLTLENVRIRYLSTRRRFTSKFWTASVSVLVPEDMSEDKLKSEIQIIADLPETRKGIRRVKLKVNLPDGIHLSKIDPEYITVNIE